MIDLDKIHKLVSNQFPSFYQDEGPEFVTFVEEYYKWLELNVSTDRLITAAQYALLSEADQELWYDIDGTGKYYRFTGGFVVQTIRDLFNLRDVDTTTDTFLNQFILKYLNGVPKNILGDKRFLVKHILDVYRSKGSKEGVSLLFRLLFNESINIYVPSYDILKPSDGKWVERRYLEISYSQSNPDFHNKFIVGQTSEARAFVENYIKYQQPGVPVEVLFISNIEGSFVKGEKLLYENGEGNLSSVDTAPFVLGSAKTFDVLFTSKDFEVGDILIANSQASGAGLKAKVSSIRSAESSNGTISFRIINGGSGYTNNATVTISTGSNTTGSGATFRVGQLSNTSLLSVNLNYINYAPYDGNAVYINAQTSVNSTADSILLSNNQFENGDVVTYLVAAGNTAISGLSNNSNYFVVNSTSLSFKLSNTYNGSAINITAGLTQNGHSFTGQRTADKLIDAVTYGSDLLNANVSTVLNSAFTDSNVTIGTISRLSSVNPGSSYDGAVAVDVKDRLIFGYNIVDSNGNFLGYNANVIGPVEIGSGLAQTMVIVNSGFGYDDNELVEFYSESNTSMTVSAYVTLNGIGFEEGNWINTDSFLNSDKYLHDNDFYQEFSYQIESTRSLDKYIDILRLVAHSAGNRVFGKVSVATTINEFVSAGDAVITDLSAGTPLDAFVLNEDLLI